MTRYQRARRERERYERLAKSAGKGRKDVTAGKLIAWRTEELAAETAAEKRRRAAA